MSAPDWTSLRILIAAMELGSIAKAATRCGIAYSAAAKRIQVLEADAGALLLERQARGVAPTAAGEAYARRARTLMNLADQLNADMRAFAAGGIGTVRLLATASAIGGHDLPESLASFGRAYPGVAVELRELTSLPILQDIFDGRGDVGLITSKVVIPDGLQASVWRRDRLLAVTASDRFLPGRKSARFSEILDCPLVEIMEASAVSMMLADAATRLGRKLTSRFRVSSTDAGRRIAAAGEAIAIMPDGMAGPYADRLGLRCIGIDEKWAARTLRLVSRPVDGLPAAARMLRDALLRGSA